MILRMRRKNTIYWEGFKKKDKKYNCPAEHNTLYSDDEGFQQDMTKSANDIPEDEKKDNHLLIKL